MSLHHFSATRRSDWDELQELIGKARGRPDRLGAAGVRRLGPLYRAVVADLAQARHQYPHEAVTHRLEQLAVAGRQLVYGAERRSFHPWRFCSRDYFRVVAERPVFLAVAALALLAPAALVFLWALRDPVAVAGLVPDQFRAALSPGAGGTDAGLSATQQAAFSTFLIVNNTQVAVLAFVAGIFFCAGSVVILAYNGMVLGAVGGVLVASGDGVFFVELVAAHGVIELSAIIVGAAGGLRMGWALVDPGFVARREAVQLAARAAIRMVVGTIPWIVVAGIIEAFVSRRGLTALPMVTVGLVVGAAYWTLVVVRGRMPAPGSDTRPGLGVEVGADASFS
jgi:uncharacterized membrane protein SpoIIM required for sporulation